jgi:hypothetical protein
MERRSHPASADALVARSKRGANCARARGWNQSQRRSGKVAPPQQRAFVAGGARHARSRRGHRFLCLGAAQPVSRRSRQTAPPHRREWRPHRVRPARAGARRRAAVTRSAGEERTCRSESRSWFVCASLQGRRGRPFANAPRPRRNGCVAPAATSSAAIPARSRCVTARSNAALRAA